MIFGLFEVGTLTSETSLTTARRDSKGLSLARTPSSCGSAAPRDGDKHFTDLLMICQRWMGSNKTWDTFDEMLQFASTKESLFE
jgi:hypothetical protein